jgi:thiosulfate/3-mercaptopyruvate sulfurtransferase
VTTLPTPLVDAPWLVDRVGEDWLRIVDCRFDLADPAAGRRRHRASHVPGAAYLSLDDDLSAREGSGRHPLPSPQAFAATLGEAGIGNHHAVVAYDDAGGAYAARVWWMLSSLGHEDVAVLDGGWQAWIAAGGGVETGSVSPRPVAFAAAETWRGKIDGTELEIRLGFVDLIDARAEERYRGEEEPFDPVAGHIPTARNLPWGGNLGSDGRFLDADELAARFSGAEEAVVYCGSGVTACHNLLAMEAAGITGGVLYPGSWSDWCTAGGEVAIGEDPGGAHALTAREGASPVEPRHGASSCD